MSRRISRLDVMATWPSMSSVSARWYSALWTTKPSSGCTGPPAKMRTVPATGASLSPSMPSSSANGRSAIGRLMTMPNAPSLSWRTIRMTVRSKRGSPIDGVAIRSWPASDAGGSAMAGAASNNAGAIAAKAKTRRACHVPDTGHVLQVVALREPTSTNEAAPRHDDESCSPHGTKRNAETAAPRLLTPDFASLHPGYKPTRHLLRRGTSRGRLGPAIRRRVIRRLGINPGRASGVLDPLPERRAGLEVIHQELGGRKRVMAVRRCRDHQHHVLARRDAAITVDDGDAVERPAAFRGVDVARDLGLRHPRIMLK